MSDSTARLIRSLLLNTIAATQYEDEPEEHIEAYPSDTEEVVAKLKLSTLHLQKLTGGDMFNADATSSPSAGAAVQ